LEVLFRFEFLSRHEFGILGPPKSLRDGVNMRPPASGVDALAVIWGLFAGHRWVICGWAEASSSFQSCLADYPFVLIVLGGENPLFDFWLFRSSLFAFRRV
jgi:hypothetical protein